MRCFKLLLGMMVCIVIISPPISHAQTINIDKNAVNITDENTAVNVDHRPNKVRIKDKTQNWLDKTDIKITNTKLINILNGTSINTKWFSLGYSGEIYLGRWPLSYSLKDTKLKRDYQSVNTQKIDDNRASNISYRQKDDAIITGALTKKSEHPDMAKQMILKQARSKTKLPLTYKTKIGSRTNLKKNYNIPEGKKAVLKTYVPAIKTDGDIISADVYLRLKGKDLKIELKNVIHKNMGAWLPVEDYVTLQFKINGE